MKFSQLLIISLLASISGAAAAQTAAEQGELTPPPAYRALMGTELELLVRVHSVLNRVCGDNSFDQQLVGKSMLLQIKLLDDLHALEDVENSDDLAWLMNVYHTAYGSGFKPGVDVLEERDPGAKARICATFERQARVLLDDA